MDLNPFSPDNTISSGTQLWFDGRLPEGWKKIKPTEEDMKWFSEKIFNSKRNVFYDHWSAGKYKLAVKG